MTSFSCAILLGGGLAALLDGICVTLLAHFTLGVTSRQVWQSVASAILGRSAFRNGWSTGLLGISIHCFVALSTATVFTLACRSTPIPMRYPLLAGTMYGILVFFVMTFMIVPMSAMPKRPFNPSQLIVQLVLHICVVGIPIALAARQFLR